jgi:hypothetical protein
MVAGWFCAKSGLNCESGGCEIDAFEKETEFNLQPF